MKRVDVACTLIFDESNENILMVKNKKGDSYYWSIPGGAVEQGETLEQAALREAKEETGYDVEIVGLSTLREAYFEDRGHHALLCTFLAEIVGGDINISDPDNDIVEVRWVDIATANEWMTYLPDHLKIKRTDSERFVPYHFHGKA